MEARNGARCCASKGLNRYSGIRSIPTKEEKRGRRIARAFGAHLVYGTVLELLRRGIRPCMLDFEARRAESAGSDQPRAVVFIDRTEYETGVF